LEERRQVRENNKEKLEAGKILEANTQEQIGKRLQHLAKARPAAASEAAGADVLEGLSLEGGTGGEFRAMPVDHDGLTLERIIRGRNDLVGLSFLELGLRVASTVGRVNIRSSFNTITGYGTGFMVSPRLLLTNNHVLRDEQMAARSQVEFNYQATFSGRFLASQFFDLDPATFFLTDKALDYTLVAVKETENRPLRSYCWLPMIEEEGKVLVGDHLTIIQHPSGEPKQLAVRENRLVDILDKYLHYETDTMQGSSGAPVFNDAWELVALHHQSVPATNENGDYLTKDGQVWTQDMGDDAINWIANEGVRISRIIAHIKSRDLSGAKDQLRSELFQTSVVPYILEDQSQQPPVEARTLGGAPKGSTVQAAGAPSQSNSAPADANSAPTHAAGAPTGTQTLHTGDTASATSASTPVAGDDGTMTWTIPLQISVSVGQPRPGSGLPVSSATGVSRPGGAASTSATSLDAQGSAGQPDSRSGSEGLRESLEELEAAHTRPYYDATADQQDRDQYYSNMPDEETDSDELYRWFSQLVKQTHANALKYNPRTHVYPWVDLQKDEKLRSVYSGQRFDPREFIMEDFQIEQEIARLRERVVASSAGGPRVQEAIDMLEASMPFNCEHVVPQSWYDKREPMRGDLHHLFACEKNCNSFRGNTPYFDFSDFDGVDLEEVVRSECGKREEAKFEPQAGKGAVARATLYFLLRYPGEINRTIKEYKADRITTLVAWHQLHPVSEYEQHRNQAIFRKQGNRNPLIDFPELAARINFALGLG
jgi:endonuclease I/V8-like Glu-specific endopeptidase